MAQIEKRITRPSSPGRSMVIRIKYSTLERLQKYAVPFEDTANTTIVKILDDYEKLLGSTK